MKTIKLKPIVAALLVGIATLSCGKYDIPDGVLSPSQMSNILKDLHLAEAYVNLNFAYSDSSKFIYKKLEDSILGTHGTQVAVFDSSMAYYRNHIKLLDEIYAVTIDSLSLKEGLAK